MYKFSSRRDWNKSFSDERRLTIPSVRSKRSFPSPSSFAESVQSRHSQTWVKKVPDDRWVCGVDEWLILAIEMVMVFTENLVRNRKFSEEEIARRHKTIVDIEKELLILQGCAAFGNLLAGVISDCYIGHLHLAFFSVLLHSVMSSILLIERVAITRIGFDPYSSIVSKMASVSLFFMYSTRFARLVLGMSMLKTRQYSSIHFFVFLFVFIGPFPVTGGLLTFVSTLTQARHDVRVGMSFLMNLTSIMIFLYLYETVSIRDSATIKNARNVVCCFFGAFWNSCKYKALPCTVQMFEHSKREYSIFTVAKAKELFVFLIYVLPTTGFSLYKVARWENIYEAIPRLGDVKSAPYMQLGLSGGLQLVILLTMASAYPVIWLLHTFRWKTQKKLQWQFTMGFSVAVVSAFYLAFLVMHYEPFVFTSSIGYVRVYNARDSSVMLESRDQSKSQVNTSIPPHSAKVISFSTSRGNFLLETRIQSSNNISFTTLLNVRSKTCTGYVVLKPFELVSVPDAIPIFKGAHGADNPFAAHFYLFGAFRELRNNIFRMTNVDSDQLVKTINISPGKKWTFELPEGKYLLRIGSPEDHQNYHISSEFNEGGLYGLIVHSDIVQEAITIDTVLTGKNLPSYHLTIWGMMNGLSCLLAGVSIAVLTFLKSPSGLLGVSFAWLSFIENIGSLILSIGYSTWHETVSSDTLLTYSLCFTILLFMTIFIFSKYSDFYGI